MIIHRTLLSAIRLFEILIMEKYISPYNYFLVNLGVMGPHSVYMLVSLHPFSCETTCLTDNLWQNNLSLIRPSTVETDALRSLVIHWSHTTPEWLTWNQEHLMRLQRSLWKELGNSDQKNMTFSISVSIYLSTLNKFLTTFHSCCFWKVNIVILTS